MILLLIQALLIQSIVLCQSQLITAKSSISFPSALINENIDSPKLKFLDGGQFNHFNLANLTVVLAPLGLCSSGTIVELPNMNWNGSFGLLYRDNGDGTGCNNAEIFAIACQKLGASAGIYKGFYNPVGAVAFEKYGHPNAALQIPIVLLQSDYFELLETYLHDDGNYIIMNLVDTPNPWDAFFSSPNWITVSLLGCLISVYTIYMAIKKLYVFVTEIDKGFKITLSQTVLWLEIIANILRFLFMIDPFGKHSIMLYPISRWLCSASLPYNLGSMILLVLYYKKLVSGMSGAKSPFFQSKIVQILFCGSVVWLIFFDIAAVIINELFNNIFFTVLELYELSIFTLVISISYIFLGNNVLNSLKKGSSSRNATMKLESDRKIVIMSRFIFSNTFFNFLFLSSMITFTFFGLLNQTIFYWSVFGVMLGSGCSSLLVVGSFQVSSKKSGSSSKNNKIANLDSGNSRKESRDNSKRETRHSKTGNTLPGTRNKSTGSGSASEAHANSEKSVHESVKEVVSPGNQEVE